MLCIMGFLSSVGRSISVPACQFRSPTVTVYNKGVTIWFFLLRLQIKTFLSLWKNIESICPIYLYVYLHIKQASEIPKTL